MNQDDCVILVGMRLEQARAALDDARFLLDARRTPTSIINRSYYAMFYAALALLQSIGKVPSRHSGVLALIDQEFVLKGAVDRQCGRDLHRAFDLRQASDYRVSINLDLDMASELWDKAQGFVNEVEKLLKQQGLV